MEEIQVHPNLVYETRLFVNHKIKLIRSGSLLGLKLSFKARKSDVGSKIYLNVFPLDFADFLIWTNDSLMLDEIKEAFENNRQIHPVIHNKFYNCLINI